MESGLRMMQQERAGNSSNSGQQKPRKEMMEASACSSSCALDSVLQGKDKYMHIHNSMQDRRFVQLFS